MTLKELQEQKMKEFDTRYTISKEERVGGWVVNHGDLQTFIQQAQQEAWNSAVEACVGALPEENSKFIIDERYDRGYENGFNRCLEESITNLNQLKEI